MAQGKVFSTGLEQLFDDDDLVCTHRKPLAQKPVKQVCDTGKTGLGTCRFKQSTSCTCNVIAIFLY